MTSEAIEKLTAAAREARKYSQAKYSNFKVGAALLASCGDIIHGSNVESSSYSLTICAERVALTKALSDGITEFKSIAIAAKDGAFCPPCGACRQLLFDYAPDIDIILTDGSKNKVIKLKELLPFAFEDSQLK